MRWEDPPVDLRGRGEGWTKLWVEELKRHPGKWARYYTEGGSALVGHAMATRLREAGAEVRMSTLDEDGQVLPNSRCRVWARWPEESG